MLIRATRENVDELFEGIIISYEDMFTGLRRVPGWQCRQCGWKVGTVDLPPMHECKAEEVEC